MKCSFVVKCSGFFFSWNTNVELFDSTRKQDTIVFINKFITTAMTLSLIIIMNDTTFSMFTPYITQFIMTFHGCLYMIDGMVFSIDRHTIKHHCEVFVPEVNQEQRETTPE